MGKNVRQAKGTNTDPFVLAVHTRLKDGAYIGTGLIAKMVRHMDGFDCNESSVADALKSLAADGKVDIRISARRMSGNRKEPHIITKKSYAPESLAKMKQWELNNMYNSGTVDERTKDRIRYILAYAGWIV